VFRVPVTVTKPTVLQPGEKDFKCVDLPFFPGEVKRIFLNVPNGTAAFFLFVLGFSFDVI
jgi:hypothetical protein